MEQASQWELPSKVRICLESSGTKVKGTITDLATLRSTTSWMIGITSEKFLSLLQVPGSFIQRFIFVDQKSLRVAYCRGLQGGGCLLSRERDISTLYEKVITKNSKVPNKLGENQKELCKIGGRLCKQMKNGFIEPEDLAKIEKISPYESLVPIAVAKLLLKNFNDEAFWSNSNNCDGRASIAILARKFLMAEIALNSHRAIFSEESSVPILNKLKQSHNRLSINRSDTELTMQLQIVAMQRLVTRAEKTKTWWSNAILECKDLLSAAISLKNLDISPLLVKLSEYYTKLSQAARGSYVEYMLTLDVFEKNILRADSDVAKITEDFIEKELARRKEMSWEEIHILKDFVMVCIKNGKIRKNFVLEFLQAINDLVQNSDWHFRVVCASCFRELSAYPDQEVTQKAGEFQAKLRMTEKHKGVINILELANPQGIKAVNSNEQREPVKCISNLTHLSPYFFGRNDDIENIETMLTQSNVVALIGLGGIGKTSLALNYANLRMHLYSCTYKINSENVEALETDLCVLAKALRIYRDNRKDQLEDLLQELRSTQKLILLIFDNANNEAEISKYLNSNQCVKFLCTSRSKQWEIFKEIAPLSKEASVQYLEKMILKSNEEDLTNLANRLERIPLLLVQSAANIRMRKIPISEYLINMENALSSDEIVDQTLESTVQKFKKETKFLLELLSCCYCEKIPIWMVKEIFMKSNDEGKWWKAEGEVMNYSFVIKEEGFFRVHRIVYQYMKEKFRTEKVMEMVLVYYNLNFRIDETKIVTEKGLKKRIKSMAIHVEYFVDNYQNLDIQNLRIMINLVEYYCKVSFCYEIAKKRILVLAESIESIEVEDEVRARLFMDLGNLYFDLADYQISKSYYLKCLVIYEKIPSPMHSDLATLFMNLGCLYSDLADYEISKSYYLKCLGIHDQILSPTHPDRATLFMNLGILYMNLKDYQNSKCYLLECLAIRKSILSPTHPDLATLFMNLGLLYSELKEYKESKKYSLKCLEIYNKVLSPKHPDLAKLFMNLGNLYYDLKNYQQSEIYYLKCLVIYEQILPPTHPDLATIFMNLGTLYMNFAKYKESKSYYKKCLVIREKIYPPNHSHIILILENMETRKKLKNSNS